MNERVVLPSSGIRLSNLAVPRIIEVVKPAAGEAITLDLRNTIATTLDFSAIANEKVELARDGHRLILAFDNQSTVTAEPFFDFSGKPLPYLEVDFGGIGAMTSEQFDALLAETAGQAATADGDNIPPSGASFGDPSVEALPQSLRPLGLLGQESHTFLTSSSFAGGDTGGDSGVKPHALLLNIEPVINIPAPGGAETKVFEAGLLASRGSGESAGSGAGSPAFPVTTKTGAISFSSADGVQSVLLGGHALTASPQTFTDATGSLTASYTFDATTHKGSISYSYTLLDNTNGVSAATFAVVVTDTNGHSNPPGNLVITIVDDAPIARGDNDNVEAGQLTAETGNVLDGTGTTGGPNGSGQDVSGADGGIGVVGVAAGNGAGGANAATIGVPVTGQFGKLTLNSDGTYSYVRSAGGGSDVFTYTIRDADGSLSHATLTIFVGDSSPNSIVVPQVGAAGTLVDEAGLSASRGPGESVGSNPLAPTAATGTINFTSLDGVKSVELGANVITATSAGTAQTFLDGTRGQLSAWISYDATTGKGAVNYTYTLLDNVVGPLPPNQNTSAIFAVVVTDLDGDRTPGGNLVITITDDHPAAHADIDRVTATDVSTDGNVIDGTGTTSGAVGADALGADGPALGGAIIGVTKGDSGGNPVTGGVGTQITGDHGSLTLDALGHYVYTRTSAGTDVFTYTIKDGDGSLSTATLTITVDNAIPGGISIPLPGAAGQGTLVDEAGLPTGSNPAANSEITSGRITFTSPDGVGSITLVDAANSNNRIVLDSTHNPVTFIDPNGVYSVTASYTITGGVGEIDYTYTVLHNVDSRTTTSTSFNVTVADPNGDSTGGNLVIDIKDDQPIAHADTDQVGPTDRSIDGNVLDGTGTTSGTAGTDVLGADGAASGGAVVQIASQNNGTSATVDTANGATLAGQFGTLTIDAQGHYTYVRDIGVPGGSNKTDVFSYTIQDSDGSQSATTLTIAVADSQPSDFNIPPPSAGAATVFEAGLPARGSEPAGSNPLVATSATGEITFISLDGVQSVELGGLLLRVGDGPKTVVDATGSLTASLSYDATTGLGIVDYTYTLLDNVIGPSPNQDTTVSFALAVTDLDNERVTGGDLVITIIDDQPIPAPDSDGLVAGQVTPETGNVITGAGTLSSSGGADTLGADGAVVVRIVSDNNGNSGTVDATAGGSVVGQFGTLTIDAHGNYTYTRTGGSGADLFHYTIQDGDGSQSTSALTIVIGDSTPRNIDIPPEGEAGLGTLVDEAALSTGSNPAADSETTSGKITFTSADGVSSITLVDAANSSNVLLLKDPGSANSITLVTGLYTLTAFYTITAGAGEINYTYSLLHNSDGRTVPSTRFAVTVADLEGQTAGRDLVIDIADDHPVANADTDQLTATEASTDGNVLDGTGTTSGALGVDTIGADGAAASGTVVGVSKGNSGGNPVTGNVGTQITGDHGFLTLDAQGHYTYTRTSAGTDVFSYTIQDGDGSQSTATLTINVEGAAPGNIVIPPPGVAGQGTQVDEAGLPARTIGGVLESAGSNAASNSETTSGTITFTSPAGVQSVELGGHVITATSAATAQTFADATGSLSAWFEFNAVTGGQIHYTYTLLDNTAGDATSANFAVAVTDTNNVRTVAGSNLVIDITDDAPTAVADSDTLAAADTLTDGNVRDGSGTTSGVADTQGADGAVVVGIAAGTGTGPVNGGIGSVIHG
ncbi:MAG TPA: VCBS domain-containing protein, partial [Pseudolabrys sp.]